MNNLIMKKMICSALSMLCILLFAIPAMAAPAGPGLNEDGTAKVSEYSEAVSRVIVVGESSEAASAEVSTEAPKTESAVDASSPVTGRKGESLGMFTTTGYCNCSQCSSGYGLTYSGTVPTAKRTISADLSVFPIGTKLMIDDVVYVVEDMGSSVKGNWIDIYYGSHEDAVGHGMRTQEVFRVEE